MFSTPMDHAKHSFIRDQIHSHLPQYMNDYDIPFSPRNITTLLRSINNESNKARISDTPIKLRGSSFTSPVTHLHNTNSEVIRQALEDKITQVPASLHHTPVVVNVTSVEGEVEWRAISEAITATGLRIMGVSRRKIPRLKTEVDRAGIPLLTEGKEKTPRPTPSEPTPPPLPVANQIIKTRLVDQPVRPGRCIYAPHCNLIVTNHMGVDAELIADDNIYVYGVMRERALTGAGGDRNAQIFCTHLAAGLVSTAGEYWLSDNVPAEFYGKAVRPRLGESALTVQPLN